METPIKRKPGRPKKIIVADPMLAPAPLPETIVESEPMRHPMIPDPQPSELLPIVDPVLSVADLMAAMSIIGEILMKRHTWASVGLELQGSGFHINVGYKTDDGQMHRMTSRKITDSITMKGLQMVMQEVKAGCGI
jgi:hypothetical protein